MQGVNGSISLHFESNGRGSTILTDQQQRPPLQVIRAFDTGDGAALVHLHNVSGGVLAGDHLETTVTVGPGARARVTSTSSTRVYRHQESRGDAKIINTATIAANGILEWLPDSLIPYAGSRCEQTTVVTMDTGSGLFWWEIVGPGRTAHNEVFQYERLRLNFDVFTPDALIFQERICLEPALRPLSEPARLGPYRYFCSFVVAKVGEDARTWLDLESRLHEQTREWSLGDASWGVSTLPAHGLILRGLGVNARDLLPGLQAYWQTAKRALYGIDAIVPRKVY